MPIEKPKIISPEKIGDNLDLKFHFYGPESPVAFEAGSARGLIMPIKIMEGK